MNTCKPTSGLPCSTARLPAAAGPSSSLVSGSSRPLVVAAGSGGSGGGPCLAHRHALAPRFRRARSHALVRSAADGRQASTASVVGADSNSSNSSSKNSSNSNNSSSSSSSSTSGTAATNGSGQGTGRRRREPCLPPLPFWAAGVSVVGLPDDQLVFSFLTPSEAAAAARRQLRPELPYGPSALKLATLQGDKVQAILDRWQYAIAQRELGSLDARPMLWWRYESALKGTGGGSTGGASGDDGGRGSASGSFDEGPAAAAPDDAVYSKRQLRRMARVAKAAAKAASHTQQESARSSRAGGKSRPAGSKQDRHSGRSSSAGGAEQQARGGLVIDQAAFEPGWQVCTLRGLPDGTTIYKFGDEFEPVVGPPLSGAAAGAASADTFDAVPTAAAPATAGGPAAGFSPDSPPSGEAGAWWRQEQRPELGKLLHVQEQQRSIEGVSWSSALRLGARFSGHARSMLKKLQIFTSEYEQQQSSSFQLNSRLHPTYEKALARVKRANLGDAEVEAQQAQRGQQDAAQRQQRGQQRQQEARRARTERQEEVGRQQQQQQQHARQVSTESGSSATLLAEQAFSDQRVEQQLAEQQQQRDAAAQVRLEAKAAPHSSSSSSSSSSSAAAAAVPEASSEEEQEWQSELLPRPQWQPPAVEQQARPGAAVTEDSEKHAPAGAASPAAEQPQQGVHQAAVVWAQLAALAAAVGAAMLRVLRPVVLGMAGFWLALYRLLPVAFRRLFWRSWPPQWPGHLSPAVRQLLHARRLGTTELQAAGFNADGHSMDPLADLQAWQVERLTGCRVRDLSLYRAALTHKSALPPELRVTQSYERLEFLGDAVLSLACRTLLMERCPTSDEGEMTKLSSLLVSGASNARYAAFLELEHYLVLDPRALREGGQHTPHILADVFEALLGALYLDAGWAAAHAFCRRVLSACVDWSQVQADAEDWKGVFSRLAYHQRRPQPRYRTTSTRKRQFRGGLQLKWYTVDVQYGGEVVGTGSGWERRWAEQAAARQALDNMGQLPGTGAAEDAALH